ncbi:MAG: repeat protein [Chitinophagaceae bacterium]|nr:repeat protein [Chitinophagaceae bacterium]
MNIDGSNFLILYTMKIILLFLFITTTAYAQDCLQTDLSNSYNINTHIDRISREENADFCRVALSIQDKKTNQTIQTILLNANFYYSSVFSDCNTVRSYTTGKNKDAEVMDNDFGDLIVADFNFDQKEDIALKKDSGGNGGPMYNFYLQTTDGVWKINEFLSDTMDFFPSQINAKKKTLTTWVHANAREQSVTTYKLSKNNTLVKTKRKYVG